jgi:GTP cyclohydrolase IA
VNLAEREAIQDDGLPWAPELRRAIRNFLDCVTVLNDPHALHTPARFVDSLLELTAGQYGSPRDILETTFPADECDQMIHRSGIRVVSTCEHHMLPIIGKAHFAYLPNKEIVGISKIPRLIQLFSRRLQVQERLTHQIVDAFQDIIKPQGCGLVIRAYHFCEIVRGVEEYEALTQTTALRGCFKDNDLTREEFLRSVNTQEVVFP